MLIATASAALLLAACGTESVSVSGNEQAAEGAEIFATHCSGCHTIGAAGTQGSANRDLRIQGPNFDQRKESYDDVLFAIHNGGFSGAIMPQNIVVGDEAEAVATFVSEYAGADVSEPPRPSQDKSAGDQSANQADSVGSADSSEESGSASGGSGSSGSQ